MKALITASTLWMGVSPVPQSPHPPGGCVAPVSLDSRAAPEPGSFLPLSAASPAVGPAAIQPVSVAATIDAKPLTTPAHRPEAERIGDAFDGRIPGSHGLELSGDFLALHAAVRDGNTDPLPDNARAARYLFVGGMFAGRTKDYFGANLRRLSALGLNASSVPLDTDGKRHSGLRAIEAAVRDAQGPVVLIGHSRGGVLAHDWYRRAPAELKAKVARLVLIQAPLAGTPFADWTMRDRWNRFKLRWLGQILFGANLLRTSAEMTPRMRRRVLDILPSWEPRDLEKVYTLRTTVSSLRGFYEKRRALLQRLGASDSDGMVPADSARVEGGRNILVRELEHKHTVLQRPGLIKLIQGYRPAATHDAGDLTEALVRLLFR